MNRLIVPLLVIGTGVGVFVLARLGGDDETSGAEMRIDAASPGASAAEVGVLPDVSEVSPPIAAALARELVDVDEASSAAALAPPATLTPPAPPAPPATPEEIWARKYADVSPAQMLEQREAIEKLIAETSHPEIDRMFAAGEYDVVGKGNVWRGEGWDQPGIQGVRMGSSPDSKIHRATLPRERFPALYTLRDESNWLRNTARKRAGELAIGTFPR